MAQLQKSDVQQVRAKRDTTVMSVVFFTLELC